MKNPRLHGLLTGIVLAATTQMMVVPAQAEPPERSRAVPLQLATGQYITPTAIRGSVQQFLNPGLAAYPNFVAGEAVRSQLSPDGRTLAIICAACCSILRSMRGRARRWCCAPRASSSVR